MRQDAVSAQHAGAPLEEVLGFPVDEAASGGSAEARRRGARALQRLVLDRCAPQLSALVARHERADIVIIEHDTADVGRVRVSFRRIQELSSVLDGLACRYGASLRRIGARVRRLDLRPDLLPCLVITPELVALYELSRHGGQG